MAHSVAHQSHTVGQLHARSWFRAPPMRVHLRSNVPEVKNRVSAAPQKGLMSSKNMNKENFVRRRIFLETCFNEFGIFRLPKKPDKVCVSWFRLIC